LRASVQPVAEGFDKDACATLHGHPPTMRTRDLMVDASDSACTASLTARVTYSCRRAASTR
jgi:hypothetical protein